MFMQADLLMGITSFNPISSLNMWGFRLPRQYTRRGPSPGLATEEASDTDLSSGGRTLTFATFENGLFFFKNFPDCVSVTWRTQGLLSRAGLHWVKVKRIKSKTLNLLFGLSIVDFLSHSFMGTRIDRAGKFKLHKVPIKKFTDISAKGRLGFSQNDTIAVAH